MEPGGGGTNSVPRPRSVLLAGATGLVGGHLLERLGADPGIARIVAPVRRAPTGPLPRTAEAVVVDFGRLDDHPDLFAVDQIFLCLGTTMKRAGSPAAFRSVDLDLVVEMAGRALNSGAEDCLLVSSLGADPRARVLYSRVKGEAERAVRALPWRTLAILRPSLLAGDRAESRPAERLALAATSLLGPLMRGPLARYRPVEAAQVAETMVRLARDHESGTRVYESERIRAIAEA
ncbi:MAG: NAD-dependent epimerase/dehydratase family protein [Gemmatimonadetes bacterium]|nr:NAD-dependent epimerase/dehydratase family protein [Gemmatimonadota bacterium]